MSFRSISRGQTALLTVWGLALAGAPALADTFHWQPVCNLPNPLWYDQCIIGNSCPGGTGATHNNWGRSVCGFNQPTPPGAGDDVVVATGHATMNLPASLANLSVSAGISIDHLLTVSGGVNISGFLDFHGEIAGPVQTTITPTGIVISDTARVDTGTFVNQGSMTHSGPGGFDLRNGAHLINNGSMYLQNNTQVGSFDTAAVDRFTNNSELTKNGPAVMFGINNIKFDNFGTVNILMGTLEIYGGANLGTNVGVINIATGAMLQFNGSNVNRFNALGSGGSITGTGKVMNLSGTLFMNAPYTIADLENLNCKIVNHSALDITTRLRLRGVDYSGSGTTTIAPGALMEVYYGFDHFAAHTFINNGTLNWTNFFGASVDSGFVLNNAGLWNGNGGNAAGPGTYINSGTLLIQNGFNLGGSASFTNSGLVDILNSGFTVDNYLQTGGTTRLNNSTFFMNTGNLVIQGGNLEGYGSVSAPVVSSGVVSPGLPLGTLYNMRGYTQMPGAHLRIELGGTPQSGQFDSISVQSSFPVVLDGLLDIQMANGYVPQSGQGFDIISHGTNMRSGQFNAILDSSAPCVGQPRFTVQYLPNSVRLVVLPGLCGMSGDMNGNAVADAGDIGAFITAVMAGPYNACADVNHDCATDGRDVNSFVQVLVGP